MGDYVAKNSVRKMEKEAQRNIATIEKEVLSHSVPPPLIMFVDNETCMRFNSLNTVYAVLSLLCVCVGQGHHIWISVLVCIVYNYCY